MTETATRRRSTSNLPINYAIAQEENDTNFGNQNVVSRSPSQSLLAQLSTSPYGWTNSSRSTSPTPPAMLSNSLRRLPSNVINSGRFTPQQSLQSLVQSFINKVSRGTQTDCDDNDFDQVSIASLTSGFSAFENDFTRSRLKSFLNDPQFNEKNIDDSEFVEELQKLRDQIDGRFKFMNDSQPVSQSVSRQASRPPSQPRSPITKEFDDRLDIDRNLMEFGQKSATRDQSVETDSCCLEDKDTQADFGPSSNQQQSSSFFSFFSSNQPTPTQTTKAESFNIAIQTDNNHEICKLCRQNIQNNVQEIIETVCQSKQNVLNTSPLLNKAESIQDINNNPIIAEKKSIIDNSTQADLKGESILSNNNVENKIEGSNNHKMMNDDNKPPILVKRKSRITSTVNNGGIVGGSGHFYRGETSLKNDSEYVNLNGMMKKTNSSTIITTKKGKKTSANNCCSIS